MGYLFWDSSLFCPKLVPIVQGESGKKKEQGQCAKEFREDEDK